MVENGEITHSRGFGQTDRSGERITPQTPFQIASVTKSCTSLVVLQLEGEGKLSIDDPVIQHLRYFSTAHSNLSDAITIRNLMNHRSGFSTLDGNLHYGPVNYALGLPNTDISTAPIFAYLFWGSSLILGVLVASCLFSLRKLHRVKSKPANRGRLAKRASILPPSLCLIGYAFTLWFYLPRSFGTDFSAASLFLPDLGLLLALPICVAVVWSVMRSILLVKRYNLE